MFHRAATLSRLRAPLLLVASLSACTPPSGHSPSSAALPEDDAARRRLWQLLAPESLPPPYRESASGAPQTDIPQTDFGLAPYSQPTPFGPLAPPHGWAAERPALSPLLLPAIQSSDESWRAGAGSYEHAFMTTHWFGAILPETLASFDRAARATGLRLRAVERQALAFTLRYESTGARLSLSRASRTELALELAVTISGELRADPAVAASLAERPLVNRLAERLTLRGARRRGPRCDFFFVPDASRGEGDLANLLPAKCPASRSKGSDSRRCYVTSDGRALVITNGARFDVLDEPHDLFE